MKAYLMTSNGVLIFDSAEERAEYKGEMIDLFEFRDVDHWPSETEVEAFMVEADAYINAQTEEHIRILPEIETEVPPLPEAFPADQADSDDDLPPLIDHAAKAKEAIKS